VAEQEFIKLSSILHAKTWRRLSRHIITMPNSAQSIEMAYAAQDQYCVAHQKTKQYKCTQTGRSAQILNCCNTCMDVAEATTL
jgi:hypothetical protein